MAGISPDIAVVVERESSREPAVYLAPGHLLQNRAHPLHDTLYSDSDEPDEERGLECEPPVSFRATAATTPGPLVFRVESAEEAVAPLLASHDEGTVFVDAQTVVSGLERDGVPYVEEGDEFELVVRACSSGASGVRLLVADSLKR